MALQITNILRDVVEDRGMGRVYLPVADWLDSASGLDLDGDEDGLLGVIAFETGRAEEWYERA